MGEKVSVTFPTSAKGRALVTLENGQRVVASEWVEPQGQTTTYEFVARPEMTPNVFVHVTLLQPYGDRENDHPIRLFGVTPVLVKDPGTRLKPVIEAPSEMRPGVHPDPIRSRGRRKSDDLHLGHRRRRFARLDPLSNPGPVGPFSPARRAGREDLGQLQ